MALIHRHLYQDSGTIIQLDTYLQRIVDELIGAFADTSWELVVDTQLVPLQLDVEQAVPLGLILNELITNALKYAFKPGKPNRLQLRLEPSGKQLILEVIDNGQAGPVSPAQGDGFGQELLQLMTDRLDAQMQRESGNGTRVRLVFPFSPAA
jgi:two-component sensor histidine kinase